MQRLEAVALAFRLALGRWSGGGVHGVVLRRSASCSDCPKVARYAGPAQPPDGVELIVQPAGAEISVEELASVSFRVAHQVLENCRKRRPHRVLGLLSHPSRRAALLTRFA